MTGRLYYRTDDGRTVPVGGSTGPRGAGADIGLISMWGSAALPPTYLVCNGQQVPAGSEYDDLRLLYPNGLPDLRDRFIMGAGAQSVGATGGAASVTLTQAQMPSHNHGSETGTDAPSHGHFTTVSDADINHTHGQTDAQGWHSHAVNQGATLWSEWPNASTAWMQLAAVGAGFAVPLTRETMNHDGTHQHWTGWMDRAAVHNHSGWSGGPNANHRHTIPAQGDNAAHENRPPFYVLQFVIRAK